METTPQPGEQTKKCPKCAENVQKDAVLCKHCGAKTAGSGKKYKIILGIFIVGMIVLVIESKNDLNDSLDGGRETSKKIDEQIDKYQSVVDNSSVGKNSQKTGKIGETISDGDLGFTASAIKSATSIGDSYTKKTASGIFYIINVKIQNNSKSTKTINASDFSMIDSQGRKYEYSTEGQMAMTFSQGGTDLFLKQVQPSLSITGSIVFDVPKDATGLKLVAQGGLFSDKVTIDLGK